MLGGVEYTMTTGSTEQVYKEKSGWTNEAYRVIEITGGTDVQNSTLIDWLWNNATRTA